MSDYKDFPGPLGVMDPQRLLAYQLRIAVVILEDAARSIRDIPPEQRGDWMRPVASSLISAIDLLKDVYARRPDLDPSKDGTPSGSSVDANGHKRVSSTLAKVYLLVAQNRKDEALALLTDVLSREPSSFHKEWLRFEISQLQAAYDT